MEALRNALASLVAAEARYHDLVEPELEIATRTRTVVKECAIHLTALFAVSTELPQLLERIQTMSVDISKLSAAVSQAVTTLQSATATKAELDKANADLAQANTDLATAQTEVDALTKQLNDALTPAAPAAPAPTPTPGA